MYKSEIKNKKLLDFLEQQTRFWNDAVYGVTYDVGRLFVVYHDIMMSWSLKGCNDICIKYWHSFFSDSQVPAYIVHDDFFELDYTQTARQILEAVVDLLQVNLTRIQRTATGDDC